jgi:hypothetical protein
LHQPAFENRQAHPTPLRRRLRCGHFGDCYSEDSESRISASLCSARLCWRLNVATAPRKSSNGVLSPRFASRIETRGERVEENRHPRLRLLSNFRSPIQRPVPRIRRPDRRAPSNLLRVSRLLHRRSISSAGRSRCARFELGHRWFGNQTHFRRPALVWYLLRATTNAWTGIHPCPPVLRALHSVTACRVGNACVSVRSVPPACR